MSDVGRPKIVVLGMMSKMPVGGVIWQTLHYLIGFERLGYETYYVEAHGRTPSMLMESEADDGSARAADLIGTTLGLHGLAGRWAYQAHDDDGRCYGLSEAELSRLYRDAAFIVNLHGGTVPRPEHTATGRLVYLETDPVQLQIELHDGVQETVDFLDAHCAFFTFAENYGRPGCLLPVSSRYQFLPTRQPVVLEFWDTLSAPRTSRFTTVANWHQPWRDVVYGGRVFGWSKRDEFRRVIGLPRRSPVPLELAVANCEADDRDLLEDNGWLLSSAMSFSTDAEKYRRFVVTSSGEFTVAKEQNVAFQTGWFSDRSATYLAAGRPVVVQDTGFTAVLPVGEGLLGFATEDDAVDALQTVSADYGRHARAAREIARSHFSHEVVLGELLTRLGETVRSRRTAPVAAEEPPVEEAPGQAGQAVGVSAPERPAPGASLLPDDLVLSPVAKRPLRLEPGTGAWLRTEREAARVPKGAVPAGPPRVSIVIPVHDRVELTQLCLTSLLGGDQEPAFEVVVVDDASADDTAGYLEAVAAANPHVRILANESAMGFAQCVNRGVEACTGADIVLLNNDTVLAPGWLRPLVAHLDSPGAGVVTACTTARARNARVDASYRTYREFVDVATARRREHAGAARHGSAATFFCAAIRRERWSEVGPLDERFGIGMFEDDDYCARVHAAGYDVVCALDVLVHHFGEGSLGSLYADGEFSRLFNANRAAFEAKWGRTWEPRDDEVDPAYQAVVAQARALLQEHVPAGEAVAVVSLGDDALIELDGPRGVHFHEGAEGSWAERHPADGAEAVADTDAGRLYRLHASGSAPVPGCATEEVELVDIRAEAGEEDSAWPEGAAGEEAGESIDAAAACTIIARNYLSQARSLAESYFLHHPGGRFYLLVLDGLPDEVDLDPRIQTVDVHDLPLDDLHEMFFKYDVVELSTAVKPALLALIMGRLGEDRLMYIDPDILIMRPMTEVFAALDHADLVLTPHLNAPIPFDGHKPTEQDILISGVYNLGFIALRASAETSRFLDWWRERLLDLCRVDPAGGLMVDQRWIDLVPSLFERTYVLRDDTYNVAYWNLHARTIERRGAVFSCNGRPLAMFHFSGFNPLAPAVLSKHQTRTQLEPGTALHDLFMLYRDLQLEAGFEQCRRWEYGLSRFDNGVGLHAIFRRLYLDAEPQRRRAFGDPFATEGDGSFFAWATRPDGAHRGLSPFLEMAYRMRYDLQAAFPDVGGGDRDGFLEWAQSQGAREFGFEPQLAAMCDAPVVRGPAATSGAAEVAVAPAAPDTGSGLPGVNVCGYLRNESGVGAAARAYVKVLKHLDVPVSLRDVSDLSVNRSEDASIAGFDSEHGHPVNLVCVNADQHFVVMRQDPEFFQHKYNIGVWWWELPTFPSEWRDRFEHYDEIWAGTSYIANALAPVSPVPVVRVQPVLATEECGDRERGRAVLGLVDEFTFLFIFDFHSYFERKNPMAVVQAFRQAFPDCRDARLVIKCVNGASAPQGLALLQEAASADERIRLIPEYVDAAAVADLIESCDAYVSLHRAEGLGLTMAHAMDAAKPVIATGWSGNTDFMDASNSLLVGFRLIEIQRDVGPYKAGGTWAEPDITHASALMRHVFDHPEEAHALGLAARTSIRGRFSADRSAEDVRARLEVIAARLGRRPAGPLLIRPEHAGNDVMMAGIRRIVADQVTDGRPVVVISKGDPVLMDLGGPVAWHFPQSEDGQFAGYYPSDSQTAIAHLEALGARGAGYLLVPASCKWWLTHYPDLGRHLRDHHHLVAEDTTCLLYRLEPVGSPQPEERADPVLGASVDDLRAQLEHLRETVAATGQWVSDLAPRVAAGQQQLAALPAVLEDAFASVSATVGALEEEMTARLKTVEATHDRLGSAVRDSAAAVEAMAAEVAELRALAAARGEAVAPPAGREVAAGACLPVLQSGDRAGRELALPDPGMMGDVLERIADIERRMCVRPYMSSDRFYTEDLDKPMGFARSDSREDDRKALPTFADVFRGEREFIADRQRAYLPLVRDSGSVLDLGCGRGEFLELLEMEGVPAEGVERDEVLVRAGQARGLRIRHADALNHIGQAPSASVDTVFSAQFIEHVEPDNLPKLIAESRRVIRPGGLFIAETVNPECHEALKTFHVDLSHHRPIFPQVLLQLCWEAGFTSAWVFYPTGGGFTQRHYDRVGEYAIVAQT